MFPTSGNWSIYVSPPSRPHRSLAEAPVRLTRFEPEGLGGMPGARARARGGCPSAMGLGCGRARAS